MSGYQNRTLDSVFKLCFQRRKQAFKNFLSRQISNFTGRPRAHAHACACVRLCMDSYLFPDTPDRAWHFRGENLVRGKKIASRTYPDEPGQKKRIWNAFRKLASIYAALWISRNGLIIGRLTHIARHLATFGCVVAEKHPIAVAARAFDPTPIEGLRAS